MNREERIEKARRMAAAHTPSAAEVTRQQAGRAYQRLSNVGASQAQRHVAVSERTGTASYLDPAASPDEWDRAVELARTVMTTRAKRMDTITSPEIKWVILDDLRLLLTDETLLDLLVAVGSSDDGEPLSSIVLFPDD